MTPWPLVITGPRTLTASYPIPRFARDRLAHFVRSASFFESFCQGTIRIRLRTVAAENKQKPLEGWPIDHIARIPHFQGSANRQSAFFSDGFLPASLFVIDHRYRAPEQCATRESHRMLDLVRLQISGLVP
jgi:hypothetical protein